MKSILLINVKMLIIVGILTASESLKARNVFIFQPFSFYEQLKFNVQLSVKNGPRPVCFNFFVRKLSVQTFRTLTIIEYP